MGSASGGKGVTLPQIAHPLSRMENPGNMDIRGMSRASDRPNSQPIGGRPLANENVYTGRKSGDGISERVTIQNVKQIK
jgi:hypothetical protein